MYRRLTELLLRWLRVPPEPHPPHGDPASLRVFRAGRNFLNLRLLKWGVAQLAALAGIIFWFGVFSDLEVKVEERRARHAQRQAAAAAAAPSPAPTRNLGQTIDAKAKEFAAEMEQRNQGAGRKKWRLIDNFYAWQHGTATFLSHLPKPAMLVIWFFEVAGLIVYVLQLPVTYLLARMDYDLRWYMVTDRSLRIRHGTWKINESTMSFANIQQVIVSQGPLQRLLGLSDVKVQSAGGGGGDSDEHRGKDDDMHLGLFHSVTNPDEIRDLILNRLRQFRESGLGDPEEKNRVMTPVSEPTTTLAGGDDLLAAANDLAAEARALRAALN
jgi:hypothetical protein